VRARALELARGALAAIEAARARVDDLNVYPVPDGDTGTNLALTVRAVVEALEQPGPGDRASVAAEAARAALLGARGNSGVILSQILRGLAEVLGRGEGLPAALRAATDAAYAGVPEPVEGTMLTAIRELAEEAERGASLEAILARGEDCVVRTEAMLPALAEAGVVDAGAAGLVEIARGAVAAFRGEPLPEPAPVLAADGLSVKAIHLEPSRYRYCTLFVLEGEQLDREALEAELEPLGDSLLVVGDASALKVHLHTDDPGRPLTLAVARGTVSGIEVANMHEQARQREERLARTLPTAPDAACAAVAVACGEGNRRLFESLGALVVDGGRTMNPSTAELLAALERASAPELVVLPNNRNVRMAAEQAAGRSAKAVRVLPSESLQAGLAAMVAFDPSAPAAENEAAMLRSLDHVAAGAVTVASRDVHAPGLEVRRGDWLGLVGGRPVAGGGSFADAARPVLDRLLEEPRDVLTLLLGEEAPPLDGLLEELRERHPSLELEVLDGGQPHYPLLVAAE
jgi:DAK2 domain fusion protein YloV